LSSAIQKIRKFILNIPETKEELIVRWADAIVLNSQSYGVLNKDGVHIEYYAEWIPKSKEEYKFDKSRAIRDSVINKSGIPIENDGDIIIYLDTFRQEIETHLVNNDYILKPDYEKKWILTEPGKLMKDYGGHLKYKAHKKRERDALRSDQNAKIYWWWRDWHKSIVGILVGGIGGLFAEHQFNIIDTIKKGLLPKQSSEQSPNQKDTSAKSPVGYDSSKTTKYLDSSNLPKQIDTNIKSTTLKK
jgi:hypothetical protein